MEVSRAKRWRKDEWIDVLETIKGEEEDEKQRGRMTLKKWQVIHGITLDIDKWLELAINYVSSQLINVSRPTNNTKCQLIKV